MAVNTLDEYMNELDDEKRKVVNDFISFMKEAYPSIKVNIIFSMPVWLMKEKMRDGYVAISVANKHFTIHFSDEERVIRLKEILPHCRTGKRCINIIYNDNESYHIVKENVKEHINSII